MNKWIKAILEVLFLFFLSLYIGKYTINYNENKKILTDQAILEYEADLKEGKDIVSKNYQEPEKDYNNRVSQAGRKLSNIVEEVFNKAFHYLMKYLEHLQ